MSKYNSYAQRLNDLFHETATEYKKLADAVEAAERELQQYPEHHPGTVYEAKQLAAKAALTAAQEVFRHDVNALFSRYEKGVDSLTAELEKAVQSECVAKPADIDGNALELLKSGIMTASDYAAMVEQYSSNATMSRMILKYADEQRKTMSDTVERQQMTAVTMRAKANSTGEASGWGELVTTARIYSGVKEPMRAKYVQGIQTYWDKPDIQEAIRNF